MNRRWYVIQAAREAGASWDEVGTAIGRTGQEAQAWYREQIERREWYVSDIHDVARARAALGVDW